MECQYQVVKSENSQTSDKFEWKPFLRQAHISSGVSTMFFLAGLCAGAPTVFIPQLRKNDVIIDDELASWLYSVSNITAIPWVLILPSFTRYTGRKPAYILTCIFNLAVYIILYFSTSPYEILAAGVVQGFANASNVTVMTLILPEYSSVKYRAIFMNVTTASCFWGIWTSNAIGTYFNWKYIAVFGIICSVYTFSIIFYPESPLWLASKGKYNKSEEAFKWLHGDNEEFKTEIQDVIQSQIAYEDKANNHELGLYATIRKKEFYKPLLLCILIGAQYNFSGKYICSAYAIEVISKMTGSEEAAQTGMLILDGVTILGMYSGSFLSKVLRRRTLYYSSAFMGEIFLLFISLYLYLGKSSIISENNIITVALLVIYSLSISCGSLLMGLPMYSELMPLKYQRTIYMITSLCLFGTTSVMLKLAPMAFKNLGIDGVFFFYGITFGAVTVILYFYLPDTEGKSLAEVEELFKEKKEYLDL